MDQQEKVYPGWKEEYEPDFCDADPFCEYCGSEHCEGVCITFCCYDPRYVGPRNYCSCTEFQKQMDREEKWWYPLLVAYWNFIGKFRGLKWPSFKRKQSNDDNELPF